MTHVIVRSLTQQLVVLAIGLAACVGPRGQEVPPAVDEVLVLPPSISLETGQTTNLGALRLQGGEAASVSAESTWSSSNTAVVTIDASGDSVVATAVGPGTASITASSDAGSGTAIVHVVAAVASLQIQAIRPVPPGVNVSLSAVMIGTDSSKRGASADLSWSVAPNASATIDPTTGLLSVAATAPSGTVTVYATRQGITASAAVAVSAATLVSVALTAARGTTVPVDLATVVSVSGTFSDGTTSDVTDAFDVTVVGNELLGPDDTPPATLDAGVFFAGSAPGLVVLRATGRAGTIAAALTTTLDMTIIDSPLTAITVFAPAAISTKGELAHYRLVGQFGMTAFSLSAPVTATAEDEVPHVFVDTSNKSLLALAPGSVTLTATAGDVEGTALVSVVDADLATLTLQTNAAGDAYLVTALAAFGDAIQDVGDYALFSSDSPDVFVSNTIGGSGEVLATQGFAGTATITATYRGLTQSTMVTFPIP